jgi:hypothetical protein
MKRILLAAALLTPLAAHAQNIVISGSGAGMTCSEYAHEKGIVYQLDRNWIMGFMSSYAYFNGADIMRGVPSAVIESTITVQCLRNPDQSLADAAASTIKILKEYHAR